MKQTSAGPRDARSRYIELLRSLNPDPVLQRRLDDMERAPKVVVTRPDVREVVARLLATKSAGVVDAVVDELDAELNLVGEHNMTTALRADTVTPWIKMQIEGAPEEFERITGKYVR